MRFSLVRCRKRQGFTLTELAIVLGVVGTLLGAIWAAASKVSASRDTQQAAADALQIVSNYRSLYTQHAVDSSADITCLGVNANFFPSDIANSATCVSGSSGTYPKTPWGGNSYMEVLSNWSFQGINIVYINLPQAACNSLINALVGSSDVVFEEINGTAQNLPPFAANTPWTASQVDSYCNRTSNNNYIEVIYKAQ